MKTNIIGQCVGLEFFSESEVIEAVQMVFYRDYKERLTNTDAIGATYRALVRANTFFKVFDLHCAAIFVGDERVGRYASIAPIEHYAKDEILEKMADVVLWWAKNRQKQEVSA